MQTYAFPWCPKLLEAQNGTWTVWLLTSPTFYEFPHTVSAKSCDVSLQSLDTNFTICGCRSM